MGNDLLMAVQLSCDNSAGSYLHADIMRKPFKQRRKSERPVTTDSTGLSALFMQSNQIQVVVIPCDTLVQIRRIYTDMRKVFVYIRDTFNQCRAQHCSRNLSST